MRVLLVSSHSKPSFNHSRSSGTKLSVYSVFGDGNPRKPDLDSVLDVKDPDTGAPILDRLQRRDQLFQQVGPLLGRSFKVGHKTFSDKAQKILPGTASCLCICRLVPSTKTSLVDAWLNAPDSLAP